MVWMWPVLTFHTGDYNEHQGRLELLKEVRKELDIPVAALLDTKGPEIRTGQLRTEKGDFEGRPDLYPDHQGAGR